MRTVTRVSQILPGKVEAFKAFMDELQHKHKAEFNVFMKKHGDLHVRIWLQQISGVGDFMIAVHEGETPELYMENLKTSDDRFAVWARAQLLDLLGPTASAALPAALPFLDMRR